MPYGRQRAPQAGSDSGVVERGPVQGLPRLDGQQHREAEKYDGEDAEDAPRRLRRRRRVGRDRDRERVKRG